MTLSTSPVDPKAAPLPPLPAIDPLTPEQWATLLAIMDTVIARVVPAGGDNDTNDGTVSDGIFIDKEEYSRALDDLTQYMDRQTAAAYLEESATSVPGLRDAMLRIIGLHMPQKTRADLQFALKMLGTRAGTLCLTGYMTSLTDLPLNARESMLKSWASSSLPLLRKLQSSLTTLAKQVWARKSATLCEVLGFPRTPFNHKVGEGFRYEFLQIPPADTPGESNDDDDDDDDDDAGGGNVPPEVIDTDVVIVGSGCGAAVCAKNIAEAGLRVVVVERAYYWPPEHLPMRPDEGSEQLFMDGMAILSDDGTIGVLAGQTFGGGGTVNWSASLQTQGFVREEWASANGLSLFTSAAYQSCLDRVCRQMGVSDRYVRHNPPNANLLEGARRLGWAAHTVPQNTGGAQHYCGYCSLGCGACEKRGPVVSFLPDAARAGAMFIEGMDVREVLFENGPGGNGKGNGNGKRAVGVRGVWRSRDEHGGVADAKTRRSREVIIRTGSSSRGGAVIVSAGTLQSPLLLLRSGLGTVNKQIGHNLHLHPVAFVGAVYDRGALTSHRGEENDGNVEATVNHTQEDSTISKAPDIKPWEGGILTAVVTQHENLDGHGHGAKLEACTMLPSIWLTVLPWRSELAPPLTSPSSSSPPAKSQILNSPALSYKLAAAKMRNSVGYISLARDRDGGQVYIDPQDPSRSRVRVRYSVSKFDRQHILEGVIALAKICYVTGARQIWVAGNPAVPTFIREDDDDDCNNNNDPVKDQEESLSTTQGINNPRFQSWLSQIRTCGLGTSGSSAPEIRFGSAHQMGSCRMSASPAEGVVDQRGRVWGVADAGAERSAARSAAAASAASAGGDNRSGTAAGDTGSGEARGGGGGGGGGLYVADASVFPSASGVNPMVTTMAIADWISRGVVRDLLG